MSCVSHPCICSQDGPLSDAGGVETTPDLMMDLSIIKTKNALSEYIINNYGIPVGIVPAYIIYNERKGISFLHYT